MINILVYKTDKFDVRSRSHASAESSGRVCCGGRGHVRRPRWVLEPSSSPRGTTQMIEDSTPAQQNPPHKIQMVIKRLSSTPSGGTPAASAGFVSGKNGYYWDHAREMFREKKRTLYLNYAHLDEVRFISKPCPPHLPPSPHHLPSISPDSPPSSPDTYDQHLPSQRHLPLLLSNKRPTSPLPGLPLLPVLRATW